MKRNV